METITAPEGATTDRLERRRVMWRRIVVTQVDRLSGRAAGSDIAARDAAARADRLVALLELDGTAPVAS